MKTWLKALAWISGLTLLAAVARPIVICGILRRDRIYDLIEFDEQLYTSCHISSFAGAAGLISDDIIPLLIFFTLPAIILILLAVVFLRITKSNKPL